MNKLICGFLGLFAFAAIASSDFAQANSNQQAVQKIIGSQIEAFKADNGDLAFSYAAPSIKRMFRNSENFMAMVREGYAPVYRPAEVEFRDLSAVGDSLVQRVYIRGVNGEAVIATYTMQQAEDGSWKISGVYIEKLPEVSA